MPPDTPSAPKDAPKPAADTKASIEAMKRRGIPTDERGPILERTMQEAGSREWEDVEVWWRGPYDPNDVQFPTGEKLETVKQKLGADGVQAVIRAAI